MLGSISQSPGIELLYKSLTRLITVAILLEQCVNLTCKLHYLVSFDGIETRVLLMIYGAALCAVENNKVYDRQTNNILNRVLN